jgi:hypothetical protein
MLVASLLSPYARLRNLIVLQALVSSRLGITQTSLGKLLVCISTLMALLIRSISQFEEQIICLQLVPFP